MSIEWINQTDNLILKREKLEKSGQSSLKRVRNNLKQGTES